ncbi:MAG: prepilin-type N-terminal cleavage/methylation domain-containing protein [Candidatus Omnitrophota bacterium]
MNNRRGYTLIEAIMTAAISSVLLGALLMVMKVSDTTYKTESRMLYLEQQARNGMDRMVSQLRASKASTVVKTQDGNDMIVFATSTAAGASFYVDNGRLVRGGSYGVKTPISSDISRLKFIKSGARLRVEITATAAHDKGKLSFPLVEVVRLRNE